MQTITTSEELIQVAKQYQVVIDKAVYEKHSFLREIENPILIHSPEEQKNFHGLESLLEELQQRKLSRSSEILCIGGGALSDLVGLAASLFKRGISYSIAPTTILSLIDASIGGKTAINTKYGKNLVGTFHFPKNIYHYYSFLNTLPNDERESGHGELVKYAFLSKKVANSLFTNNLEEAYRSAALYKEEIVRIDPYEKNERKLLNLGHTIGHAIETRYKVSHGKAVFLGLEFILKMYNPSLLEEFKKIKNLILKDTKSLEIKNEELISFIEQDKKISGDEIDIIIPVALGESEIKRVTLHDLKERLKLCI